MCLSITLCFNCSPFRARLSVKSYLVPISQDVKVTAQNLILFNCMPIVWYLCIVTGCPLFLLMFLFIVCLLSVILKTHRWQSTLRGVNRTFRSSWYGCASTLNVVHTLASLAPSHSHMSVGTHAACRLYLWNPLPVRSCLFVFLIALTNTNPSWGCQSMLLEGRFVDSSTASEKLVWLWTWSFFQQAGFHPDVLFTWSCSCSQKCIPGQLSG